MADRNKAISFCRESRERFLAQLGELVAIPSISTESTHAPDLRKAAEWARAHLESIGFSRSDVIQTAGHPVVLAERETRAGAPTVLVYGHYDVQPVDPVDLWSSDPFRTTVREDYLYGRGTTDMKAQFLAALNAVEAAVHTEGVPVNVKVVLEGEEEIGSPHFAEFVEKHKDRLAADICLNPDTGMPGPDQPAITYSLRGLAYFEIRVSGPSKDLHSGLYGGTVQNPASVLARLLAGMHDGTGRITLPGFYDAVRPLEDEERASLARLPLNEQHYLEQTGAPQLWGEHGFTPVERVGARPTLEVNGMVSGFTGEGSKTVLPASAMAKVSMRLVADQDPAEVRRQLEQYLRENTPPTVRWSVKEMASAHPSITDRKAPAVRALATALEQSWSHPPVFVRGGGTIAVVSDLQRLAGLDSVLTGFSLPDDDMHSPNERLHLLTWYRGTEALVHFFFNLAESGPAAV